MSIELDGVSVDKGQASELSRQMSNISDLLTVLEQPMNELDYVVKDGLRDPDDQRLAGVFLPAEIGLAKAARHFASVSFQFLSSVKTGKHSVHDYELSPLGELDLSTMNERERTLALTQQMSDFLRVMECCDVVLGYKPMNQLTDDALSVTEGHAWHGQSEIVRVQASCRRILNDYFNKLGLTFWQASDPTDDYDLMMHLAFFCVDELPEDLQWYHGINAGSIPGFYHCLLEVAPGPLLSQLMEDMDDGECAPVSDGDDVDVMLDRMEQEVGEMLADSEEVDQTLAVAVHILRRAQVLEMDAEYVASEFDSELVNAHVRRLRTYATSVQWREVCDNVQGILSEDEAPAGPSDALAMASEFRTLIGILDLIRPDFVANPAAMDSLYRLSETFDESLWRLTLNLEAPAA
jgi:hypothetical protein